MPNPVTNRLTNLKDEPTMCPPNLGAEVGVSRESSVRVGGEESAEMRRILLRSLFGRGSRPVEFGVCGVTFPSEIVCDFAHAPSVLWLGTGERRVEQQLFRLSFREQADGPVLINQLDAVVSRAGCVMCATVRELKFEEGKWQQLGRNIIFPGLITEPLAGTMSRETIGNFDVSKEARAISIIDSLIGQFARNRVTQLGRRL